MGSTNNMNLRLKNHFNKLKQGEHVNRKLQKDFIRYGGVKDSFKTQLLTTTSTRSKAEEFEQIFMEGYLNTYNILPNAGTHKGRTFTNKTIQKMSETGKKRDLGNFLYATAKLNEEKAYEILVKFHFGYSREKLANDYGVTRTSINNILRGSTWNKAYQRFEKDKEELINRIEAI